ncbi:MAG: LysM peptidoglycan-binding domain-containing protein [Flavobacteriales bacterium]|nr:LysM peptidoglycan-binding domain-containing protein [Flavobacteriales bacterium]
MNKPILFLLFCSVLLSSHLLSASVSDTLSFSLQKEDPKLAQMDSLWSLEQLSAQQIETDTNILNRWDYASDSIPLFSDSLIQIRLSKLNEQTPFELVYNQAVKTQISVYANTYRNHVSRMLGKANYYFPLFESKLDEYDLPLEFKYLAIVESALKPHARSRSAATGLWQFMYATGKIYDLKVTSYIDERSDPLQSTIAACEYFTFLYKMFNDWELVLAAYNGGPGYVSRAMRQSGAKDYWSVRPYLRKETQNYVPKFIAVNYIMNYASEHNIYPTPYEFTMAETDTVSINQSMTFEVLSETLGVDIDIIKELNPIYKRNLIPVSQNSTASIRLPYKAVATFVNNSDSIYAYSESLQEKYVAMDAPIVHRVKKGEYLGRIASQYHTTIGRIKNWNNLSSNDLSIGQKLVIYVNPDSAPNSSQATTKSNSKGETIYTVKSGDTLWDIARKYSGVSVAQIEQLNNITYRDLKPGLTLKIPKTG